MMGEHHHGEPRRISGDLLKRYAPFHVPQTNAAVLLRNEDSHNAHLAQFRNDFHRHTVFFIPLGRVRSDLLLRELRECFTEHDLLFGEVEIHMLFLLYGYLGHSLGLLRFVVHISRRIYDAVRDFLSFDDLAEGCVFTVKERRIVDHDEEL